MPKPCHTLWHTMAPTMQLWEYNHNFSHFFTLSLAHSFFHSTEIRMEWNGKKHVGIVEWMKHYDTFCNTKAFNSPCNVKTFFSPSDPNKWKVYIHFCFPRLISFLLCEWVYGSPSCLMLTMRLCGLVIRKNMLSSLSKYYRFYLWCVGLVTRTAAIYLIHVACNHTLFLSS